MLVRLLLAVLLASLSVAPGRAQGEAPPAAGKPESNWVDPGWRRTLARYDVSFEEDGSSRTVYEFEILLTQPKGLRAVAQQVYGYDSYFTELSATDLATVKADGRVIAVDPRAVNDQPAHADLSSPYFDEQRIRMIAYP